MKKRIISLALVIAMLLLTLCSCSFNYSKRNLEKYASFDSDAFVKALQTLVIADADFGTDETVRQNKVLDTIFKALATDAGTDNKVLTGTVGKYDVLYYGYYATFEKDVPTGEKDADGKDITEKVTYVVMHDSMNPAKPGSVQSDLSDTEGFAKEVLDLFTGVDITDKVFTATAEGKTELGDTVYLSYVRTYSVPLYQLNEDGSVKVDEDGNPVPEVDTEGKQKYEAKTETVNYGIVTLPTALPVPSTPSTQADETTDNETTDNETTVPEPTIVKTFFDQLVGQKIGKVSDIKVTETVDGEELEVTYSSIQLHWIVESDVTGEEESEYTFTEKTYTATKKVNDIAGVEHDLKDVELTYHVFPMYIVEVADELTPEIVLKKLYGTDSDADGSVEDSEKGNLDILTSEEYKNGEETLKALAEKLVTAYNELAKAQKALTTAKDKAEEADDNTSTDDTTNDTTNDTTTEGGDDTTTEGETTEDTTEDTTTTEKTDLEKAQEAYDEKLAEVNELVEKILAAVKGEETVESVLVQEYKDAVYDNLEASYESAITTNLSKEVFKLAEKYITFTGKLPKSAVRDAYKRIEDTHEYNFYHGTVSSSTTGAASGTSNYSFYGSYEAYVKSALGLKETDSMDTVEATIMKQAEEHVKDLIIVYTLADFYGEAVELTKEQKKSVKNNIYVVYLGVSEDDVLHALQFDNIMNYILEVEEKDEDDTDNKVKYKHLSYEFEVDEEETEGDTTEGSDDTTTEGGEN